MEIPADLLLSTEEIVKFQSITIFLTEICLIYLSLQIFLASKFALGDFPRQLGKESSPVLLICLYLASCCAWWQSVVLQFPCFFMKNKSTEFYIEQCSYAVLFISAN